VNGARVKYTNYLIERLKVFNVALGEINSVISYMTVSGLLASPNI